MDEKEFKETLLEFLTDVTTLSGDYKASSAPNNFITISQYVLLKEEREENGDYWLTVHFYTSEYKYHVVACLHSAESDRRPYLGCQTDSRLSRPGEDWTRGRDMYDGVFNRETWNRIKNGIIKNEMKALSKYITKGRYTREN